MGIHSIYIYYTIWTRSKFAYFIIYSCYKLFHSQKNYHQNIKQIDSWRTVKPRHPHQNFVFYITSPILQKTIKVPLFLFLVHNVPSWDLLGPLYLHLMNPFMKLGLIGFLKTDRVAVRCPPLGALLWRLLQSVEMLLPINV